MKRAVLFLALALAAGTSQADSFRCEIGSDYDVKLDQNRIRFTRADGTPTRVEIEDGRLRIDGGEIALSRQDIARLQRYGDEMLALEPEVKAVALEAVDIAFFALSEVARGLSGDSEATLAKLTDARGRVERKLREAPETVIGDDAFGDAVGDAVAELVPALVGDIVQAALTAAFSGDTARAEELAARADQLEADIERRIEPRAQALEARARSLCDRVSRLDAIESELDYRLPGGERLDLLRSGPQ